MRKARAAFVGFGEVNTPREIIEGKCTAALRALEKEDIDLAVTRPVSDDPRGRDAARAVRELKKKDFDALVLCVAGWIPSHAVIKVASEFAHIPMVLWGLAGHTGKGTLLTTADQAGTTALRQPMTDLGYTFKYVYDFPDAKPKTGEVADFVKAAGAARELKHAKVGMMGCRDMKLYGTMYDAVSLRAKVGPEVEFFEMLEIVQRIGKLKDKDVQDVIGRIKRKWDFEKAPKPETLVKGVQYYLAIRKKAEEEGYGAVSLIDVDGMKKLADFPPAMVFMLLADEMGLCTVPENDTLGAVTQLMVKFLTGQIGAYLEFYEFMPDRLLMGVPDYVPSEIVQGRTKVRPAEFGDLAEGIMNISKVKTGRVTICRLTSSGSRYRLHLTAGKAVTPRKWEEVGWTPPAPQLPGLEVIPDCPVDDFAQKVMGQHYILSYGDQTGKIKDLCRILGIDVI